MNDFEKACSEAEKDRDYSLDNENAIEWIRDEKVATVTFSQGRYITKVEKLAEKHPDDVQIVARNKGSIVAHIPVKAIKINLSEGRELSEEEKNKRIEALRKYRESKNDSFVSKYVDFFDETP